MMLSVQAAPPPVTDFLLSITPATVNLIADGTAVPVSLLATPQNGFSSAVQVALTGLPAGVAVQPSSVTLTPGTPATLSLKAPSGTAAASSTATLTATSGSLIHTAALSVTVSAPTPPVADFSLGVSPPTLTLAPGGAGQPCN